MSPRPAASPTGGEPPAPKTTTPMTGFSGVVFKGAANMDANHRDRIAFVRVASAATPGMKMKVQRTGKKLRPTA